MLERMQHICTKKERKNEQSKNEEEEEEEETVSSSHPCLACNCPNRPSLNPYFNPIPLSSSLLSFLSLCRFFLFPSSIIVSDIRRNKQGESNQEEKSAPGKGANPRNAMPATEYQGSFLGRISIRRNQVVSMDGHHEQELEDLDLFQRNIADRFSELLSSPPPPDGGNGDSSASVDAPFLSVAWLRKLLDVFLCCEAEFKAFLMMGRERDPSVIVKPPLDRLLPELLDRAVKALDVCNAVMHGVDAVRHCQKLSEIAVAALKQRPIGEGQARRAKKALGSMMAVLAAEDKESGGHKSTERNWSFGRRGGSTGTNKDRSPAAQFRTLSWGVAKNWSASKQIQAMSGNLVVPRGGEATGLALPVYIMGAITVLVMSALVAAIPCQERSGLGMHLQVPKQFGWAQPMTALQEKIGEEWKRKEKRGTAGLMEEVQRMERLGQALAEFADSFQFPSEGERAEEAAARVVELAETCRRMEEGLVPLQMQIREVFHRIVRSRSEVLDVLDQAAKLSAPTT